MFGILFSVCIHGLFGSLRAVPMRSNSGWLEVAANTFFQVEGIKSPGGHPQIVRHAFVDVHAGRGHEDAHGIGTINQDVGNLERWLGFGSTQCSSWIVILKPDMGVHGLDEITLGRGDLLRHGELQTFAEAVNGVYDDWSIDEVAREARCFAGARRRTI